MLLTRLLQARALLRPTLRAASWHPALWAAVLGLAYVFKEAPGSYIDYRILVLRLAALLLAMGAAFALDDPTEETLAHVPLPLVLRRLLRIALLLPLLSGAWLAFVLVASPVPARMGGPLPVADLTIEAATLLVVAFCAASAGARATSDRLGGIVAAPVLLALVAIGVVLPADQRMILGTPSDVRWDDAHEWWRAVLVAAAGAFLWLSRSRASRRRRPRRGGLRPA